MEVKITKLSSVKTPHVITILASRDANTICYQSIWVSRDESGEFSTVIKDLQFPRFGCSRNLQMSS